MPSGLNILTHSRIQSFKTCPRKHQLAYIIGLRKERDSDALRFGTWFHKGLDWLAQGRTIEDVCGAIRDAYAKPPAWAKSDDDLYALAVECEQVCCMVAGYVWRWGNDGSTVLTTESKFELPIWNPDTGQPTPTYVISGKKDKIVLLADGRMALREHKTTGDSIDVNSDYWKRVRIDHQITLYFWAERTIGLAIDTIEYDVVHKPGIEPKSAVPVLDEQDRKIVVDAHGDRVLKTNGEPRLTADSDKGYRLLSRPETLDEYAARLMKDIGERPDFYYARQEVPRLQEHVDEFLLELWQTQKTMRAAELHGYHFRNTGACASPYRCEYLDICHGSVDLTRGVPEGFVVIENIHQELTDATTEHTAESATAVE